MLQRTFFTNNKCWYLGKVCVLLSSIKLFSVWKNLICSCRLTNNKLNLAAILSPKALASWMNRSGLKKLSVSISPSCLFLKWLIFRKRQAQEIRESEKIKVKKMFKVWLLKRNDFWLELLGVQKSRFQEIGIYCNFKVFITCISPVQWSTCPVKPDMSSSPCDFTVTEPPRCLMTSSLGNISIKYFEKLRTRRMALYVSQVKSSLKETE